MEQGMSEMAIIQKFDGLDWRTVSNISAPQENLAGVVWSFAETDRGVAYRAVEVRKRRGMADVSIKELTPVLCAATFNVEYTDEFGEKPKARHRPNLR